MLRFPLRRCPSPEVVSCHAMLIGLEYRSAKVVVTTSGRRLLLLPERCSSAHLTLTADSSLIVSTTCESDKTRNDLSRSEMMLSSAPRPLPSCLERSRLTFNRLSDKLGPVNETASITLRAIPNLSCLPRLHTQDRCQQSASIIHIIVMAMTQWFFMMVTKSSSIKTPIPRRVRLGVYRLCKVCTMRSFDSQIEESFSSRWISSSASVGQSKFIIAADYGGEYSGSFSEPRWVARVN